VTSGNPAAWGRVGADGTVYVRTTDGERVIGSWQAGDAEAALAFFALRYADLEAEVVLLEARLASGKATPGHTREAAERIRGSLTEAKVIGDLSSLEARLGALVEQCTARIEEQRAAKAARAAEKVAAKRALIDEAERLAESTQWKKAGDRLREIAAHWRDIHVDRATDGDLWRRLRRARARFAERRSEHFNAAAEERQSAKERKEKLVAEAESLAESRDWKPTAARLKALMREWKTSGRADRPVEDALWTRFRAAQDAFFTRLGELNAARDAEAQQNKAAHEALLAEAESLDPAADLDAAQTKLRGIQDRWDKLGRAPRDAEAGFDARLAAVSRRMREAADARHREASVANAPLVIRLRESVDKLERRIARARAAGKDAEAEEAEAALATQRTWLAQAEGSPTDL
jgi:hypothetical protein